MKIVVIGLDCAAPEILFGDERLSNIRRLMDLGCFGKLESVVPPITVPAWMCMATSQDPGMLGVYGFRNRADHSYSGLKIADSRSIPRSGKIVASERMMPLPIAVCRCISNRSIAASRSSRSRVGD